MYDKNAVMIAVIIMSAIIAIISVIVFKNEKKKNGIKKSIRENCTPRRAIIKDILIESRKRAGENQNRYLLFYLVIEDKLTGKKYISYGEHDYTSYSTIIFRYPSGNFKYDLCVSGNKLNIGDEVNIYINQEIEIIKKVNGMINLNGLPRKYKGRRGEILDSYIMHMEKDEIVNVEMDQLMYEETEIVLYEGFIDTNLYE